jgi:two-component system, chemotaxis family, chemotaxis protein CheY
MSFRILVADESLTMRRLVCRFLDAVGVGPTFESENADETLSLLKASPFNVVIVDSHMPSSVLGGIELIREIRALQADLTLIVMTTDADEDSIHAAIEAGATEYLVKPFGVEARQRLLELCRQDRPVTLPKLEWSKGP